MTIIIFIPEYWYLVPGIVYCCFVASCDGRFLCSLFVTCDGLYFRDSTGSSHF